MENYILDFVTVPGMASKLAVYGHLKWKITYQGVKHQQQHKTKTVYTNFILQIYIHVIYNQKNIHQLHHFVKYISWCGWAT